MEFSCYHAGWRVETSRSEPGILPVTGGDCADTWQKILGHLHDKLTNAVGVCGCPFFSYQDNTGGCVGETFYGKPFGHYLFFTQNSFRCPF